MHMHTVRILGSLRPLLPGFDPFLADLVYMQLSIIYPKKAEKDDMTKKSKFCM